MPKVVIYTMPACPYCISAKRLFDAKGVAYEEKLLGYDDDAAWDTLESKTGFKTMPQIFINDQFVGGYNDVAKLDAAGKLDALLH